MGWMARTSGLLTFLLVAGDSWSVLLEHKGQPGVSLVITGRVVDAQDRPLPGVSIQVFQGVHHEDKVSSDLPQPRLQGHLTTNQDGRYRIEIIVPSHPTGAGPTVPIQFRIAAPHQKPRWFELFFAGDGSGTPAAALPGLNPERFGPVEALSANSDGMVIHRDFRI